ncbi:hypothetical protein [Epilithonimonas sp. UC225_85]|uniref:hypothetical protein n=1 Tax=Epilithonimonas sp. UC225_85 TaxID=3350167 RepID=UPI0036D409FC
MVGKIEIIYSQNFIDYIDELTLVLYKLNYFSFLESAYQYTDKIYDFVDENIDKPISKHSPKSFQKFGEFYIKYKANENTTWYIFFDRKDHRFLVTHILNNHTEKFPELFLE